MSTGAAEVMGVLIGLLFTAVVFLAYALAHISVRLARVEQRLDDLKSRL